jgi:hypothetical protein
MPSSIAALNWVNVHYQTEADLLLDLEKQTLTIRLHHLANVMSDNVKILH